MRLTVPGSRAEQSRAAQRRSRTLLAASAPSPSSAPAHSPSAHGFYTPRTRTHLQCVPPPPSCLPSLRTRLQAGKLAAAETVLGDMAAAGVRPNCVTFTTLMDGHVRAGDMPAALRVLDAMLAAGEAPNAVAYNTLLRGYASAAVTGGGGAPLLGAELELGGIGGAAAAAGPTAAAAAAVAPSGSSASAGAAAAPAVAVVAAAAGSAPAAAQQQQGPGPGQQGQSCLSAALQLLNDMQARGVAPEVDTFNTLMGAAVGAGEAGLALELHQQMRRAGLRPDGLTYTTLIVVRGASCTGCHAGRRGVWAYCAGSCRAGQGRGLACAATGGRGNKRRQVSAGGRQSGHC